MNRPIDILYEEAIIVNEFYDYWKNRKITDDSISVIFLDYDGATDCYVDDNYDHHDSDNMKDPDKYSLVFDHGCISNLNKIIEATGAHIVLSSSWRPHDEEAFDIHVKCLEACGFKGKVIGCTPMLYDYCRGTEIADWIATNGNVKSFVILDDDLDMHVLLPFLSNTVSPLNMRSDSVVDKAIDILLNGPKAYEFNILKSTESIVGNIGDVINIGFSIDKTGILLEYNIGFSDYHIIIQGHPNESVSEVLNRDWCTSNFNTKLEMTKDSSLSDKKLINFNGGKL